MKSKLTLATVAVALATMGSAGAADLARPVLKAPPPPPPVYSWTGCYLDAGVGYGMWNQEAFVETFPGLVPLTATVDSGGRGWLGRAGGGCDYQFAGPFGANWVVGILGDYDWMNLKTNAFTGLRSSGETERSAWYVGGRIGWVVFPQLLTYVSGGYTQTRFDSQTIFSSVIFSQNPIADATIAAHTYSGWFIGSGYEYNLSWFPGLSWKTEYRYASYRADDLPIVTFAGTTTQAQDAKKFVQTVTSSLVWRFNWGGGYGGGGYARY